MDTGHLPVPLLNGLRRKVKIRTNWFQYLYKYKQREVDIVFSKCPEKLFHTMLELGAGDGFQSTLLTRYASRLISTDLDPSILKNKNSEALQYRICDAEEIDKAFNKGEFDVVFSSNLLEHLNYPGRTLTGVYDLLKDNGITIHIVPNPFWKFCSLLFRLPYIYMLFLEKITQNELNKKAPESKTKPKTHKPFLYRLLVPNPHGASESNIREFYLFSKSRWKKQFEKANLELINIIKGPVASGYGFGIDSIKNILERLGFFPNIYTLLLKKAKTAVLAGILGKMRWQKI